MDLTQRQLVVLLPCYNEASALPSLLDRIAQVKRDMSPDVNIQVLLVDDGCVDATVAIAQQQRGDLEISVLQHCHNQGLGAALLTGIKWYLQQPSIDRDDGLLAVMDADATHPPELLPQLLERLEGGSGESPCDVVIASRFAPGGEEHGLSRRRKIYSRLACAAMKVVAHTVNVCDYSCGYRLYRRSALQAGVDRFGVDRLVTETGFTCMPELLVKLARCGARISETPLKLHYEQKIGVSKMNIAATIRRYLALVWHVMFDRAWR